MRRRSRGISAVEILVGLAVGLVLVAGMGSMVVGSRKTSAAERNLAEMQATGRVAIDVLTRELRKAGYSLDRERTVAEMFPAAAAPFVTAGAVVAADAGGAGFSARFQGAGDTWTSDCLGNAVAQGSVVWQTIWLEGGSLRCRARNLTLNTDQAAALIPLVEAFDVTYGVDDDGDRFADAYRAAAAVADWSRVVSVNLQLRVLSAEDRLADAPQPYLDFDGFAVTPNDRRLRRSYATVVALRNVLP